jgi:hypothetical protein
MLSSPKLRRAATNLYEFRNGGYWTISSWELVVEGIGPVLAIVCGVLLARRARG